MRDEFEKAVDQDNLKDVTWTGSEYKATPRSNSLTGAFRVMDDWEIWQKAWKAAREQGVMADTHDYTRSNMDR